MKTTYSLLSVLLLTATATAQVNFVKNGDFNLLDSQGMPLLWTVTSKSFHNFKITDHAYNGSTVIKKGVSCTPGGSSAYSKPYPLVILEQKVAVPPAVPLEFSMDLAYSKNYTGTNVDRSQVKVYIGTQLLGTYPPSRQSISGITTEVDHFSTRTVLTTGGTLTLRITAERYYYSTGVFCHMDNVFLGINANTAFTMQGDRKIGKNFTYQFLGDPNATVLSILSSGPSVVSGGYSIPGFSGTLQLDVTFLLPMWSGVLDASGVLKASSGPFPNDTRLKGIPFWWQGLQITTKPSMGFGNAHPFAWF